MDLHACMYAMLPCDIVHSPAQPIFVPGIAAHAHAHAQAASDLPVQHGLAWHWQAHALLRMHATAPTSAAHALPAHALRRSCHTWHLLTQLSYLSWQDRSLRERAIRSIA